MKKFPEVPALSAGPFQNVQQEVIYFPFVVIKSVSELSKIVACTVKVVNVLVRIVS